MTIFTRKRAILAASTALFAFAAVPAFAAGYAVKEQSATAQGYSYAGSAAAAEDISYMFFNPAAIAFHEGSQAVLNGAVIYPVAEIDVNVATNAAGQPISGSRNVESDELALVPSNYGSLSLTDNLTFGIGVNAPFGLVTDYGNDWAGRYHATRSDLLTLNASPTLAYKFDNKVAIAVGAQIQYADAELGSVLDLDTVATSGASTGQRDVDSKIEGDGFGFGFTLGAAAELVPGTRVGLGYRSEIKHDIDGRATFDPTNPVAAATLNAFQNGLAAPSGARLFNNGDAQTSVTTPAMLNFGIAQDIGDRWTVMADAHWTQWSVFDELRIDFADNTPDSVATQDWDDSWFLAVGARYKASDKLTLRMGLAYDEAAANDTHRTPRIPDVDRYWVSFGAGYEIMHGVTLNAAYTYVHADDGAINLSAADPENASRGNLFADLSADVHILTFNGVVNF